MMAHSPGNGLFSDRSFGSRGAGPVPVHCQELDEEVDLRDCFKCDLYGRWAEEYGDTLELCRHEFEDRQSRGYYDGTWDEHPENFEPGEWENLQERKKLSEDAIAKTEAEWEAMESDRRVIKEYLEELHEHEAEEEAIRARHREDYEREVDLDDLGKSGNKDKGGQVKDKAMSPNEIIFDDEEEEDEWW